MSMPLLFIYINSFEQCNHCLATNSICIDLQLLYAVPVRLTAYSNWHRSIKLKNLVL